MKVAETSKPESIIAIAIAAVDVYPSHEQPTFTPGDRFIRAEAPFTLVG